METPWGRIQDIDRQDKALALRIISSDKDALIEGLIVETTFDQILTPLVGHTPSVLTPPNDRGPSLALLDIDTVIAAFGSERYAFVWARSKSAGLGRYLMAMEKVMRVFLVTFDDNEFLASEISDGRRSSSAEPIQITAERLSGRAQTIRKVNLSVRDQSRINGAYWGFLENFYGDALWDRVILGRLLINYGIAPYFPQVWNIDRVGIHDGKPWVLEVKHKFPFGDRKLKFGINLGELENISLLHNAGIGCLHALLVKPRWVRNEGSLYLFNDRKLARKVVVIAMDIGKKSTSLLSARNKMTSGRHTSISGESKVRVATFACEQMTQVGDLSRSDEELSAELIKVISGQPGVPVTREYLEAHCVLREQQVPVRRRAGESA